MKVALPRRMQVIVRLFVRCCIHGENRPGVLPRLLRLSACLLSVITRLPEYGSCCLRGHGSRSPGCREAVLVASSRLAYVPLAIISVIVRRSSSMMPGSADPSVRP